MEQKSPWEREEKERSVYLSHSLMRHNRSDNSMSLFLIIILLFSSGRSIPNPKEIFKVNLKSTHKMSTSKYFCHLLGDLHTTCFNVVHPHPLWCPSLLTFSFIPDCLFLFCCLVCWFFSLLLLFCMPACIIGILFPFFATYEIKRNYILSCWTGLSLKILS